MRFRIEGRVQRGAHPPHRFILHKRCKPGKAQRLVDREAIALAKHERRAGDHVSFDWHEDSDEVVDPVTVRIGSTTIEVMATPIHDTED